MAADHLDHMKCPDHGGPIEDCQDPEKKWYPQRQVCRAKQEQAAADRRYDELHEARPFHAGDFTRWAEKASAETPFHFRDGVTIFVAEEDLKMGGDFLGQRQSDTPLN